MQSSHELDDGDWHDVQVKQNLASFTLIVDDKSSTQRYSKIILYHKVKKIYTKMYMIELAKDLW